MLNDDMAAREYLLAPEDSYWEWREEGGVVTWKNGATIAFRGEAAAVVEHLAPRGLPPFSAMMLLLAATRQGWTPQGFEASTLITMLRDAGAGVDRMKLLTDVLILLDRVRQLEVELRSPVPAKCALAELVFEGSRWVVAPQQAMAVVEAMRGGLGELVGKIDPDVATKGYGPALLMRDLGLLHVGLRRADADALRLRIATGLTALPTPAEIELPPAEAAFNLISSLAADDELAGLGRVARRLLSSATLPRRLSAEPEQELGGYSDIANRGSLERMLASELAYDNLTLAVRVAMNEALYLRRESPPSRPQQHRAVLIDAGIRTWGVPRVFAAAASLAFAATMGRRASISYFRARGAELEPTALLTRPGLVDHLATLEPDLHLADAIPAFLDGLGDSEAPVESILVMSEDGLADPAVQDALRRAAAPQLFLATVNRQGRFRMYERRVHGVKLLHEATLDLDELLTEGPKLIAPAPGADLPAIFSVHPFPLYLSHAVRAERTWYGDPWGVLSVTNDRRLLIWAGRQRGARQITDRLPRGDLWWVSQVDAEDRMSMVIGPAQKLHLVRVDRHGRQVEITPLQGDPPGSVCGHQGVLFLINRRGISVVSMQTGAVMEKVLPPSGAMWQRDRFFKTHLEEWFALSHDGQRARFEQIDPTVVHEGGRRLAAVFDLAGVDGPAGVTEHGNLYNTATQVVRRVRHNLSGGLTVPWVAPDGHRFQLITHIREKDESLVMVDVKSLSLTDSHTVGQDDRAFADIALVNLRRRFFAAGVTDLGRLALQSARGQVLSFQIRDGLPNFAIEKGSVKLRRVDRFEPMPSEFGYSLSCVQWNDGSRCVLDGRGLLHLCPANRSIPQATLVLAEGELSGWSSDGRAWGKFYFVSAGPHVLTADSARIAAFEATVGAFAEGIDA